MIVMSAITTVKPIEAKKTGMMHYGKPERFQRTGKSTFVVSLPKSWATKNSVNSGSMLFISQNQNGDLILTTDRSEMNLKTEINIGDKVGEPLFRDIIGCYLAGYRTIEVTSPRMFLYSEE